MRFRTFSARTLVAAAALCLSGGLAHAEFQIQNGDQCQPVSNATPFFLDSGSLTNPSTATQGYVCPVSHLTSPYDSRFYYQPGLQLALGYHLPAGGSISCAPVARSAYGSGATWGTTLAGTSSNGALVWTTSLFPHGPVDGGLSLFCSVAGGGRIDGFHTSR